MADESIEKLYDSIVPGEITSVECSAQNLLLWIIAMQYNTLSNQFLLA